MQELVAINILIGDRNYRIKINPKDEETVRGIVKVIQDKVGEFKTHFAGKDMQDYIAMVLVWFATDQASANPNAAKTPDLSPKLQAIEDALDKTLGEP